MKTCKSAKCINGVLHAGDKVIYVPQCKGTPAFYGRVIQLYKIDVGCTWAIINTPKGELRYAVKHLLKGELQ